MSKSTSQTKTLGKGELPTLLSVQAKANSLGFLGSLIKSSFRFFENSSFVKSVFLVGAYKNDQTFSDGPLSDWLFRRLFSVRTNGTDLM